MLSSDTTSTAGTDITERVIDLLTEHVVHFVYKHSPTCSLCQAAILEVRAYAAQPNALPVRTLDVFRDRAITDTIESVTGVRHESPQVLLVRGGVVQWHVSHRRVTTAAMTEAVRQLTPAVS